MSRKNLKRLRFGVQIFKFITKCIFVSFEVIAFMIICSETDYPLWQDILMRLTVITWMYLVGKILVKFYDFDVEE